MSRRPQKRAAPESYPKSFYCALSKVVMSDPAIDPEGYTYERAAISAWLGKNTTSPMTGSQLSIAQLVPNRALRAMIEASSALPPSVPLPQTRTRREEEFPGIRVYQPLRRLSIRTRLHWDKDRDMDIVTEEEVVSTTAIAQVGSRWMGKLEDGRGWIPLFDSHLKGDNADACWAASRPIERGCWRYSVSNGSVGLALRTRPDTGQEYRFSQLGCDFPNGAIIHATHRVVGAYGGVYVRVFGFNGWLFESRGTERSLIPLDFPEGSLTNRWFSSTLQPHDIASSSSSSSASSSSSSSSTALLAQAVAKRPRTAVAVSPSSSSSTALPTEPFSNPLAASTPTLLSSSAPTLVSSSAPTLLSSSAPTLLSSSAPTLLSSSSSSSSTSDQTSPTSSNSTGNALPEPLALKAETLDEQVPLKTEVKQEERSPTVDDPVEQTAAIIICLRFRAFLVIVTPTAASPSLQGTDASGRGFNVKWLRKIAMDVGLIEVVYCPENRMLGFISEGWPDQRGSYRVNVFYSTRTVSALLSKPEKKTTTSLFRHDVTLEEVEQVLGNPRHRTAKSFFTLEDAARRFNFHLDGRSDEDSGIMSAWEFDTFVLSWAEKEIKRRARRTRPEPSAHEIGRHEIARVPPRKPELGGQQAPLPPRHPPVFVAQRGLQQWSWMRPDGRTFLDQHLELRTLKGLFFLTESDGLVGYNDDGSTWWLGLTGGRLLHLLKGRGEVPSVDLLCVNMRSTGTPNYFVRHSDGNQFWDHEMPQSFTATMQKERPVAIAIGRTRYTDFYGSEGITTYIIQTATSVLWTPSLNIHETWFQIDQLAFFSLGPNGEYFIRRHDGQRLINGLTVEQLQWYNLPEIKDRVTEVYFGFSGTVFCRLID